jgi:hypothetical protein
MSTRELKRQWAAAEQAAIQAEMKVKAIGQAAAHPAVAEMLKQSSQLREEADRLLRELIDAEGRDRETGA